MMFLFHKLVLAVRTQSVIAVDLVDSDTGKNFCQ